MTKIITQQEYYSVQDCMNNPTKLYVFGDNVVNHGKGGQAIIRDCPNTFGIPTKMFPSITIESYFMDTPESFDYVDTKFIELYNIFKSNKYEVIIFPKDGLGTGLARMPQYSPKLFNHMCESIKSHFGLEMNEKGFK